MRCYGRLTQALRRPVEPGVDASIALFVRFGFGDSAGIGELLSMLA